MFPDAKVISLVRDVSWIMDSVERQFRQNAFEHTWLFNSAAERSTVYTRLNALANGTRLFGYPWHALREACYYEFTDRIIIVEHDLLTQRPVELFKSLCEFLGEELYDQDLAAVHYDAPQFDAGLGLERLHRVHREAKPRPRMTILPPDRFERCANLAFWRDLPNCEVFRIVAQQSTTPHQENMPEGPQQP